MQLLKEGLVTVVAAGGHSVQVADTTMGSTGGYIVNPLLAKDQGINSAESLWVNLLGMATIGPYNGTVEIAPGQTFLTPPNCDVWVNAQSSGHAFTAIFSSPYEVPFPPGITPGMPGSGTGAILGGFTGGQPFPPAGVTGLTNVIPSYLYQEYSDDDDLQEFVQAQNQCQQDYVDTFNALNLPIYTSYPVAQTLLDWVGAGLYGMNRPALSTGQPVLMGPLNTWGCNWIFPNWGVPPADVQVEFGLNMIEQLTIGDVVNTDDDLYRRILTWHFYKGDGNYFSIRWLKRRIWRFLYCPDGKSGDFVDPNNKYLPPPDGVADIDDDYIADTKQISVTLGVDQNVSIRFVLGTRTVTGGAMLNAFGCNGFEPQKGLSNPQDIGLAGIYLNDLETTYVPLPPLPYMPTFKEALDSGVLEVPYQFNFTCQIG